jgi:hypothetical protein
MSIRFSGLARLSPEEAVILFNDMLPLSGFFYHAVYHTSYSWELTKAAGSTNLRRLPKCNIFENG